MQGGSGFWLLGICAAGAALLLGLMFLFHPQGDGRIGGGILAGTVLFAAGWRWVGRRFKKYI
jgi:hypothetical protein